MESRSTRDHLNQQLRQPWSYGFSFAGAGGISWPPQMRSSSSSCYTCGYCKREFRSAQALGGHMNVHRRERARLRHYCCGNPNYPTHCRPPPPPPLPDLNYFPGDGASTTVAAAAPAVYSFFSTAAAGATAKAALDLEVNQLELGIGGFSSSDGGLDLELRLGCS